MVRIPRSRLRGSHYGYRSFAQERGCTAGCGSRRISVAVIDGSAAGRVDQMHAAARKTGHGLIALLLRLVRLVGDPALHTQAGLRAAVKECSHGLITESGRGRNRAGAQELQRFGQGRSPTGYFSLGGLKTIGFVL